jgi:hypothetical protein
MALLYGRAGRLNTKNAGFRPGQIAERVRSTLISEVEHVGNVEVHAGFGRMGASHRRSSKSYKICE